MKKFSSVEEFIETHDNFSDALKLLRELIDKTELQESIKWNMPVYSLQGKNVLSLGSFKHHFGIWFFQGVFLQDKRNLLEKAQEKTKGMRHIKFKSKEEIDKGAILAYIKEAIENQKLGKEIKPAKPKTSKITLPDKLNELFKSDTNLKSSYERLSPYKQKEYAEYISSAKRESTKKSRLEKIIPMIENGVGLNDKYKNC